MIVREQASLDARHTVQEYVCAIEVTFASLLTSKFYLVSVS